MERQNMGNHKTILMICRTEGCHQKFKTTPRNKLGLCPYCMDVRRKQQQRAWHHRDKVGETTMGSLSELEQNVMFGRSLASLNRGDGEIGGAYSFASLGELYHWPQLAGKELDMEVMNRPVEQRAGRLLRPVQKKACVGQLDRATTLASKAISVAQDGQMAMRPTSGGIKVRIGPLRDTNETSRAAWAQPPLAGRKESPPDT